MAHDSDRKIQDLVYEELRRSLMQGVFQPGQRLSLRQLAAQLGTSIMPVRAATSKLVAEHALEHRPNRAIHVPEMTKAKFTEITYWRKEIEGKAARLACGAMDDATLRRLQKINEEIDRRQDAGDWKGVLASNYAFHFAIYEKAGSDILLSMIRNLWLLAGPSVSCSLPSPKFVWDAEDHCACIEALTSGDGAAAERALRKDIQSLADFLVEHSIGEQPAIRRVV
jgi:DNA-binding GntR family transcriptional regulator